MTPDELLPDENRDELLERLRSDAARIHQLEANFAWIESERAQTQRERDQLREQVATLNANVDTFLAELDQARDQRDKAEDDLARSLAAWESAGMQGGGAATAMLRLQARIEAQDRELDRWRHGVPIEGDYVCEYALKLDEALKGRDEARLLAEKHETAARFAIEDRDGWKKAAEEADAEIEKAMELLRKERDEARWHAEGLRAALVVVESARDEARAEVDAAYLERGQLVALLSKVFPAGLKRTEIPGWSPEWHGCVFVDFPWGQASWHYHERDAALFAHLGPYTGKWDGHTTEEKYKAIAAAQVASYADLRAEVERLRSEAAPMNEHFMAGYRDGYRDAYRRGAEAMREACARVADSAKARRADEYTAEEIADALRALPIPEEP